MMLIKDSKVYDVLKEIALTILPGIAIAYAIIANAWDIGYIKEVVMTISGIDFLLGAVIHLSASEYKKSIESLTSLKDAVLGSGDCETEVDEEIAAVTEHDDDDTQLENAKG